ncbi:MAG: 2-oxoacid:ferredoxin oxidoreductase subunit beta [Nitrosomonadales bacterium]|nr:2-oxoacid:ferredoxin oxidoreductase subunit beta [Nitrosomonadales bacterium]
MSSEIAQFKKDSPMSGTLRMDRMSHIWCPGCGIGSEVNAFAEAVKRSGIDPDKLAVVSGIGCTGRVAGYVDFDSIHTTHGRAIPVATGLKLARPDMKVVVFSGEGDLTGIGGNHFIHAARRNMDIVVICNNNFTYGMTGGQVTPTTPHSAISSTTPFGNHEYPFNLPFLADAAGATYIARWTSMHSRNLIQSIEEALSRKGFSFIEVISPCTTLYLRRNRLGDGVDALQFYQENAVLKHGADTRDLDIDFQGKITIGKFVEKDKPTYIEALDKRCVQVVGDDYELYGKTVPEREAEEKAEKERVAARRAAVLAEEEKSKAKAAKVVTKISAKIPVKTAAKKAVAKTPAATAKKAATKVAAKTVKKTAATAKAASKTTAKAAAKKTTAKAAVKKTRK